jgi:5-(carboxyamino)imidazole ribonucleotide synthase
MKRIGIIGGGQLAWMMADAAKKLGLELVIQTPQPTDPAVAIASHTILAAIDDAKATEKLAAQCEWITFENEFVDLKALFRLEQQGVQFYPSLKSLGMILDKYLQRCYLRDIGLPTPAFMALEDWELGDRGILETFPLVLKTRRHGYDGQGTFIIHDQQTLDELLQRRGRSGWLVEEFVPFEKELAVMVARSRCGTDGESKVEAIATYPVVETQQSNQVCQRVFVTRDLPMTVTEQVEAIAKTLLDSLNYVGIMGIEFFLTRNGKVLINETAPRTHNSGHFTLDACKTSQFEQQLRAICGLPLADSTLCCSGAVMVNLLGYEDSESDYLEKRNQIAQIPHAHLYWYGKTQSHIGRKLGHVTVLMNDTATREAAIAITQSIESIWYP